MSGDMGMGGSDMGMGGSDMGPMCAPPVDIDYSGTPPDDAPGAGCSCTRRGAGVAPCPQGVNQSASGKIGPGGGTLVLMGQQGLASGVGTTLDIPAGAVDHEMDLSIVELSLAPPSSLVDFSPIYRFDPPGQVFAAPIKFRIPFGSDRGGSSALSVYWAGCNSTFHRVPDGAVGGDQFMEGTTNTFGWAVVGLPKAGSTAGCP